MFSKTVNLTSTCFYYIHVCLVCDKCDSDVKNYADDTLFYACETILSLILVKLVLNSLRKALQGGLRG